MADYLSSVYADTNFGAPAGDRLFAECAESIPCTLVNLQTKLVVDVPIPFLFTFGPCRHHNAEGAAACTARTSTLACMKGTTFTFTCPVYPGLYLSIVEIRVF